MALWGSVRHRRGMTQLHSDTLLGGTWTCDLENDDVYVQDARDEIHELLQELIDTLDD